jgi:hypothetical protein
MSDNRINPKPQKAYGIYNYGALLAIRRLRTDAVRYVEEHTGEPWAKAKRYMEVHRVVVTKAER